MISTKNLFCLIVLFAFLPGLLLAQGGGRPFSEEIMVVSNYSNLNNPLEKEQQALHALLDRGVRGIILNLQLNPDSGTVQAILPSNQVVSGDSLLVLVNTFLADHPDQLITLFLHANFSSNRLMEALNKSGLSECLWVDDKRGQWPGYQTMTSGGHQLVVFTYQQDVTRIPGLHYLWDYAVEPFYSIELEPEFDGTFAKGKPVNPLLYFAGYNLPADTSGLRLPYRFFQVNENPFLVSHLVNLWKRCGKKPNFIVVNKFTQDAMSIMFNLQTHVSVNGQVSHNARLAESVHWDGDFQAITSGGYSFPYMYGENVELIPDKPGFRMEPKSIIIDNISRVHTQHVRAFQHEIHKDMIAFFPFDFHLRDKGPRGIKAKEDKTGFYQDNERGGVLTAYHGQKVELPTAQELGLYNSDFTLSAWVKVDTFMRRDLSVFGNDRTMYRNGLHLQLRQRRPYMGFFSNDLHGSSVLQKDRWYHLTWRYTKKGGEMAIFVNGELDSRSFRHPSFMGSSPLMIGKSIRMDNAFCGKIDDLAIWGRPLGDDEIWNLYQDVYELEKVPLVALLQHKWKWASILVLALLFGATIWGYKGLKRKRQKVHVKLMEPQPVKANTILLFGVFEAVNKDGEDVSAAFTTKVRLLFVALLLYSLKSKKGISSDDLNQMIWPELSRKNAANNRGVTMNKLRQIIAQFEGVDIVNHNEMWHLELGALFCDYAECLKTIKKGSFSKDAAAFSELYNLVQRGSLLSELEYDWLDEFKGAVASEIIDAFIRFMESSGDACPPELTIKLCDRIFEADPFNEEAIHLKTAALKKTGQYNKAKFAYQSFAQRYEESMGKAFDERR